jgi:hypothetical protein
MARKQASADAARKSADAGRQAIAEEFDIDENLLK